MTETQNESTTFFFPLFDSTVSSRLVSEVVPKYWLTYWKGSNIYGDFSQPLDKILTCSSNTCPAPQ